MTVFQFVTGLSPHVRGNLFLESIGIYRIGSIPARAGEPAPGRGSAGKSGVYPRKCGGTIEIDTPLVLIEGLSPHVRGNPDAALCIVDFEGSIPGRAGEPFPKLGPYSIRWVYPRTCGGTNVRFVVFRLRLGLSPHLRGNHDIEA